MTLLGHYWRDDDPVELTAAIGRDWADVLEGIPQEYVQRACIQYQREEPRRKPTPGAIYERAAKMMPKPERAPAYLPPPPADRPTPEEANEILRKAGFKVNKFGGVL